MQDRFPAQAQVQVKARTAAVLVRQQSVPS